LIKRNVTKELHLLLQEYPIVTVLGPRQAGKTTLVQHELPDYAYVSLEDPDERILAAEDPRAFLRRYPDNTIFDEVQRVPTLLSYLQGIVDIEQKNGRFVLTGSHQLELRAAVTQSLAGRTGLLHLLPLSIEELTQAGKTFDGFEGYVLHGFLPRVHSQNSNEERALYTEIVSEVVKLFCEEVRASLKVSGSIRPLQVKLSDCESFYLKLKINILMGIHKAGKQPPSMRNYCWHFAQVIN
jgi:predicted AAA+ superfamily ATPase